TGSCPGRSTTGCARGAHAPAGGHLRPYPPRYTAVPFRYRHVPWQLAPRLGGPRETLAGGHALPSGMPDRLTCCSSSDSMSPPNGKPPTTMVGGSTVLFWWCGRGGRTGSTSGRG